MVEKCLVFKPSQLSQLLNYHCRTFQYFPFSVQQAHDHIATLGIHMDRRYYETPETFNPEHFTKEAKASRHPYAYLAFGHGPRNCIGMRFALLEAKMGIIAVLRKYTIKKCPETPTTITRDPASFLSVANEALFVKMEERKN